MQQEKHLQPPAAPHTEPPEPEPSGKGWVRVKIELAATLETILRIVAVAAAAVFLATRFGITLDQFVQLVQALFK